MLTGSRLLITGGTGTFGNAVLRRYLRAGIGEIRVFSRDEKKQDDMRNALGTAPVKFYLGDVRDPSSLVAPMQGADYVFHAAALKQVPSCEFFPMEAVRTNVIGAENVLNAALAAGVKRLIVPQSTATPLRMLFATPMPITARLSTPHAVVFQLLTIRLLSHCFFVSRSWRSAHSFSHFTSIRISITASAVLCPRADCNSRARIFSSRVALLLGPSIRAP